MVALMIIRYLSESSYFHTWRGHMGHIYTDALIRGLKGDKKLERVLVDTGASFTVMSLDVVKEVAAIETPWSVDLMLGDKRMIKAKVYVVEVEVGGRKGPVRIAAFKDAIPALGVDTLETLGLQADPVSGKLTPVRGEYLLYV